MDLTNFIIRPIKDVITVNLPKEYYEKTTVLDIPPFKIDLEIKKDNNQDYILYIKGEGNLVLEDARSLKDVMYPFSLNISEKIGEDNEIIQKNLKNNQNILDIMSFLWENIVLEIPISYTTENNDYLSQSGFEVKKGEKEEIDSRLAPLLELLAEEKE